MEYDNLDRLKKVRGFVLGLFGSFIFAFSSVVVTVRQQPSYLAVGALSVSALVLAYFALRTSSNLSRIVYLIASGTVLAAEASVIMEFFLAVDAGIYTFATLGGALLALKGIMDMETLKIDDYYWRKKKEGQKELTI